MPHPPHHNSTVDSHAANDLSHGAADAIDGPPTTGHPAGDTPMTTPDRPTRSGLPKLRPGQLRDQILDILAKNPAVSWSVAEVSAMLGGRSSGAVGNALQSLTRASLTEQCADTPRRYRATTAGVTAHGAVAGTRSASATATPHRPTPATTTASPATTGPATTGPRTTGSGAASAVGPPPKPGAVPRPNGDWYLPRKLAGGTDIEVLRRLRRDQIPVLLYGPPGTGKTSLVEAAFGDVVTVAGHGDTCVDDLLGSYTPTPDGGFTFSYGPLVIAMREGRALLIDDATLISPKVLAALYPAMDGRGTITIPTHHHETITATTGFYPVAGHNPGVHGAVLTEALASRFAVHIEVTTDFDLARSLGVPAEAVTTAANLNRRLRNGDIDWAPQLRELLAFKRIADTLGTHAAVANLTALAPEGDRDTVTAVLKAAFGYTPTPLTLGEQP